MLIGAASGVLGGMGIGGGVILIPALTMLFGMKQQSAQNINLLYFIPTAVIALVTHAKNDSIEKKSLPPLITAGVIGAIPGALLAVRADPEVLRKFFGVFLLIIGLLEFFKKENKRS